MPNAYHGTPKARGHFRKTYRMTPNRDDRTSSPAMEIHEDSNNVSKKDLLRFFLVQ